MSDLLWAELASMKSRVAAMEAFFHRNSPGWNELAQGEAPEPAPELNSWEKPVLQSDGSVTPPPPIGSHPDDHRLDAPVASDAPMADMTVTDGVSSTGFDAKYGEPVVGQTFTERREDA
jgi:hypothetical protein